MPIRQTPLLALLTLVAALAIVGNAGAATYAPASKQVLRVNVGQLPASLDPGRAMREGELVVQNALFAPLYRSASGSSGALRPFLAARAPRVQAGGRRITVTLRAARWSDGRPIVARDVVLASQRARGNPAVSGLLADVASVRATGMRTVQITMRRAVPWYGSLLASNALVPVPAHVISTHGERWTRASTIVSSGPFRYASRRGATELKLVRNDRWWGARSVRLRQLVLRAVPAASASALFAGKRLDASTRDTTVHESVLDRWRTDPRYRRVAGAGTMGLYLNTRANGPLAQAEVRRGIALALDRAAISERVRGAGPIATTVPPGPAGLGGAVGASLLVPNGGADRDGARHALAQGGWSTGRVLRLVYASDAGPGAHVAGLIQTQLGQVGVRVQLVPLAARELARVGYGVSPLREDVDLVVMGWLPDYLDPQAYHRQFACDAILAGSNLAGWCEPSFDAALADATRWRPFAERTAAHGMLEQQLTGVAGAFPMVPLYELRGDYLVQRWVRGFRVHPSGLVDFERAALLAH